MTRSKYALKLIGQYLFNQLYGLDQWVNTVLAGDPDETLSGRMGRYLVANPNTRGFAYKLCKLLHKLDPDHCIKSIEEGQGGRDLFFNPYSRK